MEELSNAPSLPGIYFIYNRRKKLIYIGQSQNIRKRFMQHIQHKDSYMSKQAEFFEYFELQEEKIRKEVERLLITNIKPFFNREALDFRPWQPKFEWPTFYESYFKYGELLIYYKYWNRKFERDFIDVMREKFGKKNLDEESDKINELYGRWTAISLNKAFGVNDK